MRLQLLGFLMTLILIRNFLQTVRSFIIAYAAERKDIIQFWISRGTKKNQSLLSLPSLSAVPLSGNMVSCAVKQEVHKLVSKKNISTLEWRHTLVSLFVIEKHMAKYRKLYDFGDALAQNKPPNRSIRIQKKMMTRIALMKMLLKKSQ